MDIFWTLADLFVWDSRNLAFKTLQQIFGIGRSRIGAIGIDLYKFSCDHSTWWCGAVNFETFKFDIIELFVTLSFVRGDTTWNDERNIQ